MCEITVKFATRDPAHLGYLGRIESILNGIEMMLDAPRGSLARLPIEVDDRFVGKGYGIPTPASARALELLARTEAVFLDPTYTAKAMAAMIDYIGAARFDRDQTVLFWHTGGQVTLFVNTDSA